MTDHHQVAVVEWTSQKHEFISSGRKTKHSVAKKTQEKLVMKQGIQMRVFFSSGVCRKPKISF